MIKELINKKSFSLIEIVVALGFSAVILTSFIALSAWSLNKAKDNETEDIAYQSLIQFNDLLRGATNNVSIGSPGVNFASYKPTLSSTIYTINYTAAANAAVKCNLYNVSADSYYASNLLPNGTTLGTNTSTVRNSLFSYCNSDPAVQIPESITSGNLICVFADIRKLNSIANDYKYTYTIRAIAEKSDGQIFDETIEGLRSGPFIPAQDNYAECN
jgi:type II secretory pathway pseudopilin PulG